MLQNFPLGPLGAATLMLMSMWIAAAQFDETSMLTWMWIAVARFDETSMLTWMWITAARFGGTSMLTWMLIVAAQGDERGLRSGDVHGSGYAPKGMNE